MCSMHGLPTIGTIGFGWFEVSGRSRVPSPPAITIALTVASHSSRPRAAYDTAAATARPTPIQKITSGQSVPARCGDHEPDARIEHPGGQLPEEADGELVAARDHEPRAEHEQQIAARR